MCCLVAPLFETEHLFAEFLLVARCDSRQLRQCHLFIGSLYCYLKRVLKNWDDAQCSVARDPLDVICVVVAFQVPVCITFRIYFYVV